TEAELARETLPADSISLQMLAARLLGPPPALGSEMRALVLAQRALDKADADRRPASRVTLAMAFIRLGRFEEAREQARQVLEDAGESRAARYHGIVEAVEREAREWCGADGRIGSGRVRMTERLAREAASLEKELGKRQQWRFPESS